MASDWLNRINWSADGLIPVVTQEIASGRVLTLAWANREALQRTAETLEAHYWSRSRKKLWRKGEESGHVQKVHSIRTDCDQDVLLLKVEQTGAANASCHNEATTGSSKTNLRPSASCLMHRNNAKARCGMAASRSA